MNNWKKNAENILHKRTWYPQIKFTFTKKQQGGYTLLFFFAKKSLQAYCQQAFRVFIG